MRLKDIPAENRPRERFQKHGAHVLNDAELLAIILRTGTKNENIVDLCHRLLAKFGLNALSQLSLNELESVAGIGPAKAMQIKAIFELNKRHKIAQISGKPLQCAEDVYEYSSQRLLSNDKEYLLAIYLDSKSRVVKDEIISIGTLNASLIHPREVFKSAIKESANSIIVVHNHPSGDSTPSEEDEKITECLFEAAEILNIPLMDHVIIGNENYYSFKSNSRLH